MTKVRGLGVLELQGSERVRICEQVKNMAHCSVSVLDPIVDAAGLSGWTQFTGESVGGGVMRGGWCCVMCVIRITTFGA